MTKNSNFFTDQKLKRESVQEAVGRDYPARIVRRSFNQWTEKDGFIQSVFETFLEVEASFGGDYLHYHNTETGEILSLKIVSKSRIDDPYLPKEIRDALVVSGIINDDD